MKKVIISIVLLLFNYSIAQHNIFMKAGTTVSWFLNAENSKPDIGYSIGISKGYHLFKGLFWEVGLGYTTRGATLENRTIQPYSKQGININAYYWDINGMIRYVDFPMLLRYGFKLNQKLFLNPMIGTTIVFPAKDYSNLKQEKFYKIYNSDINDWYDYDYHFAQESVFGNNRIRFIFDFGIRLQYSSHSLNLLYEIDNTKEYWFKNIDTIKYKINSILVYYSYEF